MNEGFSKDTLGPAVAAFSAGRPDEAERICRRIAEDYPREAQAHFALGGLLQQLGKNTEARDALQTAANLDPENTGIQIALAKACFDAGDAEGAKSALTSVIEIEPYNIDAQVNLGMILHNQGNVHDALKHYDAALEMHPEFVPALSNKANALRELQHGGESEELSRKVLQLEPQHPSALNNLGLLHINKNDTINARKFFKQAKQRDPQNPVYAHNLGLTFAADGNFKEARQSYEDALKISPDYTEALLALCQITPLKDDPGLLDRLKTYADRSDTMSDDNNADIFFALGKAHSEAGKNDEAFTYFTKANSARRSRWPQMNIAEEEERVAELIEAFSAERIASLTGGGVSSEAPIFILGMPRSGTTLVEQIISSHSQVFQGGELMNLNDAVNHVIPNRLKRGSIASDIAGLTPDALKKIGEHYLAHVEKLSKGASRITDKLPANFLQLGFAALALPNARIIHCVRDPLDTCLSCFFTDFDYIHYFSYELEELGRFYNLYTKLMAHWRAVFPDRFLDVHYEQLINEFEPRARKIIDWCGLDWENACLRFYESNKPVKTASVYQVRQAPYTHAIGKWQKYAEHLKPLRAVLAKTQ
ncbi:MAG: sulfotransferase [Gammaproteobacteria bacterium]|nr:sulfotransferase [Gammaproteobacteria bacterium]